MKDKSLAERLIYLDAEFVSRLYESEFDVSPKTQITRTQGLQASASLALFSGGGSSSESRSYSISTLEMLDQLAARLRKYPTFDGRNHVMGKSSAYFWVEGTLGTNKVRLTRTKHTVMLAGAPDPSKPRRSDELVGEEAFFSIKSGEDKFALSPMDQYFVSGVAAFKGLSHLVINQMSLPCSALLRIFSSQTSFKEWVATPLVIYDSADG